MKPSAFLSLLLVYVLSAGFTSGAKLSLSDAKDKGLIKIQISGNNKDSSRYRSGYYGPCLLLMLESTSRNTLNLELENGRFLETADSNEQRMIVTQQELITLLPGKKKEIPVFAMCTEMHDRSPGPETLLALGPMADGKLLELTQFIGKNRFQSLTGQEALWVLTDNNDLGSIYSENDQEFNQLQQLVSKLSGKKIPPAPHKIEYAEGMVSGEIVFENKGKETYFFVMENESGEVIGKFFEDKTISQAMVTTLTWRFKFKGFPKGVYYVKLRNSRNDVVASRPVVIN